MTTDHQKYRTAILAMIEDNISLKALEDLVMLSENAAEFEAGMDALVHLDEIVGDHYDYTLKPPEGDEDYDGQCDEAYFEADEEEYRWREDYDPDEDWYRDGGPFGPID